MLMTQKYHSANEIDPEFIPELEGLLSYCVPSFELIKTFEKDAPEHTTFHYYLFFSDKHNGPVGFTQVAIENKFQKQKSMRIFRKLKAPHKSAHWKVPGSYQEALVVEPRYKSQALVKASKLFEEFDQRDDILMQTFKFGQIHQDVTANLNSELNKSQESTIADTLVKNQPDYQRYLEGLASESYKQIKSLWQKMHQENISINTNEILKELFAYKDNGAKLYKEIKNNKKVKQYSKLESKYISIEQDNEILAIIFLIKGHGHHYFYDYVCIDQRLPKEAIDQIAIMNFYEIKDSDRLHLLFAPKDNEYYKLAGFTSRKQIELTFSK